MRTPWPVVSIAKGMLWGVLIGALTAASVSWATSQATEGPSRFGLSLVAALALGAMAGTVWLAVRHYRSPDRDTHR